MINRIINGYYITVLKKNSRHPKLYFWRRTLSRQIISLHYILIQYYVDFSILSRYPLVYNIMQHTFAFCSTGTLAQRFSAYQHKHIK